MEKLCKKCILPENYAGIKFNDQGVCNLCEEYTPPKYFGEDKFKEDVSNIIKNKAKNEYDCIVSFSGGRDSTYLLWYVVKILKLKPLAVFVNSKLIPEVTLSNINKTTKILNVDLVIKEHNYLQKSINHYLTSWQKYPDPATLITLCTGCRLGFFKFVHEEANNRNISLVLSGGTPFEKGSFKKNLISPKRNNSFLLGYTKQIIKNPSLISNFNCLKIQAEEFYTVMGKEKKTKYEKMSPFYNYIKWDEKKVDETIKTNLGWKNYAGIKSAYRGDCEVGIIRQYLYNKMLGYNDKDDHLSWLIRDNQISREEALKRIDKEKNVNIDILKSSFSKFGVDFYEFISTVEKNAKKHNIKYKKFDD